ncbi:hypothetical protein [Bradyrhizobium sp. Arg816]|uniref:hypothetical protein n=1 Tax=Bradyrhizobium sp. Arg816 TaxID=2998491 RepID=UPI00249F5359|nr:hypothetical protein [Bradyrhizobium sp. Arg816]MDI3559420.1 hypothetical protein [Bradyrhizobium sp. Arg816]
MKGGVIYTYNDFEQIVGSLMVSETSPRMMGVLFAQEGQKLTKDVLEPAFKYLNRRSGADFHLILAGWENRSDNYSYTDEDFLRAVEIFEANSKFKYRGRPVLLLFAARAGVSNQVKLSADASRETTDSYADLSSVMQIQLDVLSDKAIREPAIVVIENAIAFAKKYEGDDPVRAYGVRGIFRAVADGIVEGLTALLPKAVKDKIDYIREHSVTDISNIEHKVKVKLISEREETKDLVPIERKDRLLRYGDANLLPPKKARSVESEGHDEA